MSPQSVFVSGNYAYVAKGFGSNDLEIVDVTNPASPVRKGSIANVVNVLLSNPVSVYISGNYAYVASYDSNALEIVDIGTVTATGINVVSANQITCTFNLNSKPTGLYNVVVTNPDGKFGYAFQRIHDYCCKCSGSQFHLKCHLRHIPAHRAVH